MDEPADVEPLDETRGWRRPAQWAYDPQRLAVWAMGIFGLIAVLAIAVLAYQEKAIPPILASVIGSCLTALVFVGRGGR